jgi:hypothetical protein
MESLGWGLYRLFVRACIKGRASLDVARGPLWQAQGGRLSTAVLWLWQAQGAWRSPSCSVRGRSLYDYVLTKHVSLPGGEHGRKRRAEQQRCGQQARQPALARRVRRVAGRRGGRSARALRPPAERRARQPEAQRQRRADAAGASQPAAG